MARFVGKELFLDEAEWEERRSRHGVVTHVIPMATVATLDEWKRGWRMTYHSTGVWEGRTLAEEGFFRSKGQSGVYSAFDIEIEFKFARKVQVGQQRYQLVVENIVDPREILEIDTPIGRLCVTPNDKASAVLPYKLHVRKVDSEMQVGFEPTIGVRCATPNETASTASPQASSPFESGFESLGCATKHSSHDPVVGIPIHIARYLVADFARKDMGHKFVPLEDFVRAAQTQCEFITKEAVLGFLREDRHSDGRPRFEERLGDDGRSASFRATKSSRFFANSPSSHISAPQVSSRQNLDQISKSLSRLLRYEHKSGLALESVVHHLQKHFKQIDRATVLYVVSTSRQGDTHRFAYDGSIVRSVVRARNREGRRR